MTTTGAVLLAGGRGSRLGGVDKGALRLHGSTLLQRALDVLQGLPVVVVGPPRPEAVGRYGVVVVREDPPLSGPAAAVVAGLAALPPGVDRVLLLAVDAVGLPAVVPELLRSSGPCGAVVVDPGGRAQWLLSIVRAVPLRAAAAALGDPGGASLRALLGGLDLVLLPLPGSLTADVDTLADARAAGIGLPGEEEEHG